MDQVELKLQIALGTLNINDANAFLVNFSVDYMGPRGIDLWDGWFAPFYLVKYCIQQRWITADMILHLLIHNSIRDKICNDTLVEYHCKKKAAPSELFIWYALYPGVKSIPSTLRGIPSF